MVLTFPGERADPRVVEAISEVVSQGYVTVLDLAVSGRAAGVHHPLRDPLVVEVGNLLPQMEFSINVGPRSAAFRE